MTSRTSRRQRWWPPHLHVTHLSGPCWNQVDPGDECRYLLAGSAATPTVAVVPVWHLLSEGPWHSATDVVKVDISILITKDQETGALSFISAV